MSSSPTAPFEFEAGYGFSNPLRKDNVATGPPRVDSNLPVPATFTVKQSIAALVFFSVVGGAFLFFIAIVAVCFAREKPVDKPLLEFAYNLSVLEYTLLCSLWIMGPVIVIHSHTTVTRRKSIMFGSFAAFAFLLVGAIAALGGKPDYLPNSDSSVTGAARRGRCTLFAQGHALSVTPKLYHRMRSVCPSLADSKTFVAALGGLEEAGLNSWEGMITALESVGALVGVTIEEPEFSYMPLLCNSMFPRCSPESCELTLPCNYFDNNWYSNISYEKRREIVVEKLEIKEMERRVSQLLTEVSDQQTHDSLAIVMDSWLKMLPSLHHEWSQSVSNCSAWSNNTMVDLKGEVWARASSPALSTLPCNIHSTATETIDMVDNSKYYRWVLLRQTALVSSIVLPSLFGIGLAYYEIIEFTPRLNATATSGMTAHLLQLSIVLTTLLSATLMVYGGSVLSTAREDSALGWIIVAVYFAISLLTYFCAGIYLKGYGKADSKGAWWSLIPGCRKAAQSNSAVSFFLACNNPKKPEYLFRILCMEGVEVLLQLGAMLSPQLQNGEIIVLSVMLVACNSFATAYLLNRFSPSPSRTRHLLVVEVLFDVTFTFSGLLRLRSNTKLSILEHLALIKPVLSLNVDLQDLFVLLTVIEYSGGNTQRASISFGPKLRVKTRRKRFRGRTHFVLWMLPIVLGAFSIVTIWRFLATEASCEDVVGAVAKCANERFYFNVKNGVLGTTSCAFDLVKELNCRNRNILTMPEAIGRYSPFIEWRIEWRIERRIEWRIERRIEWHIRWLLHHRLKM